MPRHLTSDAQEWINEVPSVPIYILAKPQPSPRCESCGAQGHRNKGFRGCPNLKKSHPNMTSRSQTTPLRRMKRELLLGNFASLKNRHSSTVTQASASALSPMGFTNPQQTQSPYPTTYSNMAAGCSATTHATPLCRSNSVWAQRTTGSSNTQ